MRFVGSIRWIALALAGLAIAAGVSIAASQLVSERIGLAAEPVSAGKELAPTQQEHPASGQGQHGGDTPSGTPTQTTTVPPPATSTTTVPTTTAPSPPYTSSTTAPTTTSPTPSAPSSGSGGEREGADD